MKRKIGNWEKNRRTNSHTSKFAAQACTLFCNVLFEFDGKRFYKRIIIIPWNRQRVIMPFQIICGVVNNCIIRSSE